MNTPEPTNTPEPSINPSQLARKLLKDLEREFAVFRDFQPLSIGIDKQLQARMPTLNRKVLRIALGLHTGMSKYLKNMAKASVRFDLDGKPGEEVSEAHREHAAQVLKERFKKEAERRKAQRQADEADRRHQEKLKQLAEKFSRKSS